METIMLQGGTMQEMVPPYWDLCIISVHLCSIDPDGIVDMDESRLQNPENHPLYLIEYYNEHTKRLDPNSYNPANGLLITDGQRWKPICGRISIEAIQDLKAMHGINVTPDLLAEYGEPITIEGNPDPETIRRHIRQKIAAMF